MKLKKLIFCLVAVIIIANSLFAATTEFSIVNQKDARIYDSSYNKLVFPKIINQNSYIIRTGKEEVVLSSDFADLYISPDSIFSITSFNKQNPSIYLLYGQVNLYILYPFSVEITCYTPTTSFKLSEVGEYIIISNDKSESIYNLSQGNINVYDSIRDKNFTLSTYNYIDLLKGKSELEISKEVYKATSIFSDEIIKEELAAAEIKYPNAPILQTPDIKEAKKLESPTIKNVESNTSTPQAPTFKANQYEEVKVPYHPDFTRVTTVKLAEKNKPIAIDPPSVVAVYLDKLKSPTLKVTTTLIKKTEIIPSSGTEDAEKKINVLSDESDERNAFYFAFVSSLVLDDFNGATPSFSIQPTIDMGTFKASLNFDIFHIINTGGNLNSGKRKLVNYLSKFINYINYNSLNEKFGFSISRMNLNINYDPLYIFTPENSYFDPYNRKLNFTHFLKLKGINHYLTVDDISFNSNASKISYFLTSDFSNSIPLTVSAGTNALINYSNLNSSYLIPEINITLPFYSNGENSIKTTLSYAHYINLSKFPSQNDMVVAISLPMRFSNVNLEAGFSYSPGQLHQGFLIENYTHAKSDINFDIKSSYNSSLFSYKLNLLFPLETNQVLFIKGKEYVEAAIGLKFNNFHLDFGIRSQGLFTNFESTIRNNTDYYSTLSYQNEDFETGISLIKNNNTYNYKIFNTIKSISKRSNSSTTLDNKLVNMGISLSYETQLNTFGTIILLPFFEFGKKDYLLSLQVPVTVKLNNRTFEFSNYDNLIYDFGFGKTDLIEKSFDILNDSTSFIRKLVLGNDNTAFHLYMIRNYKFKKTSNFIDFNKYSFKDNLTSVLGTRLGDFGSFDIIVPNLSKPNLVSLHSQIFPTEQLGFYDINSYFPFEFLIKDENIYSLRAFPYIKISLYNQLNSFNFSLTTPFMLETLTGSAKFHQYLINNSGARFTLAAGLKLSHKGSNIMLDFGTYKGRNDFEYFTPYYEVMGYNFENSTSFLNSYDNKFKYFAKLGVNIIDNNHEFKISYKIDDIASFGSSDYLKDTLNLDYSYSIDQDASLSLGIYVSSVKTYMANLKLKELINKNTTLSYFSLKKNIENYSLKIQLNYAPKIDGSDNTYFNSFSTLNSNTLYISTLASIRF